MTGQHAEGGCESTSATGSGAPALADLDAAWDDFIAGLVAAREELKNPANNMPPAGDRNNAEGYRYLLGHVHRLIETETQQSADFPYFQVHPGLVNKYTIENPDCLYLYAPIRADAFYRIRGEARNFAHWRGARAEAATGYAPNYAIFEAHTVAPGDSGSVTENTDGSKATIGKLDTRELEVADNGTFEILVGPSRPAGYRGNFIQSAAREGETVGRGDVLAEEKRATRLYVRQLFADWEREWPLRLHIERIGADGEYPPARTAAQTAGQLRELGRLVRNHMTYWTRLYSQPLHPSLITPDQKLDTLVNKPLNDLYKPRANTTAYGGGQSTNAMTGGVFDLEEDQALILVFDMPVLPDQLGFQLANYWGESLEYASCVTSLNHAQSYRSSDGAFRYVVSTRDPGIQNWLDTTGHASGRCSIRFTYSSMPGPDDLPRVSAKVVPVAQVRENLPSDTPVFTREDRIQQIRVRQEHVARRYQQFR